jgi:hypothetical protein
MILRPWTPEEDATLRALYESATPYQLKVSFSGRSYTQIRKRALALGLRRPERDGFGRLSKPRANLTR